MREIWKLSCWVNNLHVGDLDLIILNTWGWCSLHLQTFRIYFLTCKLAWKPEVYSKFKKHAQISLHAFYILGNECRMQVCTSMYVKNLFTIMLAHKHIRFLSNGITWLMIGCALQGIGRWMGHFCTPKSKERDTSNRCQNSQQGEGIGVMRLWEMKGKKVSRDNLKVRGKTTKFWWSLGFVCSEVLLFA